MRRRLVLLVAVAPLILACTGSSPDEEPPATTWAWTERELPEHPGAPGRTVVRDAVECGDSWYVVGGVLLDDPSETRDTRPAAWRSGDDGASFVPVEVRADTYWGRRAVLGSVACSQGRVAVVGARSGGAHGNPRVTTFHLDRQGTLVDVRAPFTQYGGVNATNVGPISGGPEGWLIAGNRVSGPSVWVTDDPRAFTLVEGAPGLTDDGDLVSLAQGGAPDGAGWVLVGAGARPGRLLDRDPLVWTSSDGLSWDAADVPAEPENEDMHRVVARDEELVAVGLRGDAFASWVRRPDGEWLPSVRFGSLADDWTGAAYVASLAVTGSGTFATVSNGASYELWVSRGDLSWERLEPPLAPTTAGDHTLAIGTGDGLLLLADDGRGGRVWTAEVLR